MSLRSLLNSKNLTLLFTACFLISLYFNGQLWSQRSDLHAAQDEAKQDLAQEQRLFASLQGIRTSRPAQMGEVRSADEELVALVVAAKTGLSDRMITLSTFSVATKNTTKGTPIQTLFVPIARTAGLKSTTVRISGKYKNLRLFKEYVAGLLARPVVLSNLSMEKDGFALSIQLIGK